MTLSPARIPVVANVDGEFYPTGPGVEEQIIDTLARQVASPVQFVKGLHTLYDAGARVLVETGPKRALWGFAADVLGDDVMTLFTNHPKVGELASFNQALCGLYAAGVGAPSEPAAAAAGFDVSSGRRATTSPWSSPAPRRARPAPRRCSTTGTCRACCTASSSSTRSRRACAARSPSATSRVS